LARCVSSRPLVPKDAKDAPRLVVVDKPGAVQSLVRLAEVGVAANSPDRDAVTVLNTIFGGMFSSRVNLNLREAHAYTYGASSFFDGRHGAGPVRGRGQREGRHDGSCHR
jgi:zinc protease